MSQKERFQSRIARIEAATATAPLEEGERGARNAPHRSGPSPVRELVMVPVAALSGFGSVVFAKWVQFHYLTDEGEYGLDAGGFAGGFMGDIVIAIVVSLLLVEILNLKTPARRTVEIVSFLGGLFAMEAVVAMMPGLFVSLFSEEWVYYSLYGY